MSGEEPEYVDTLTTDADGLASITIEEGEYELIANASGFDAESFSVTLDSDQTALLSLSESVAGESGDYSYETYLEDGQWTVVTDHPDYWADITTISVTGDPQRYDPVLAPYGDAIDTTGLTEVGALLTDSDGRGRFEDIAEGAYALALEHENYQRKTLSLDHETSSTLTTELEPVDVLNPPREGGGGGGRTPPVAGSPEGFDPGITLPDGDPHFEVSVLSTDAGSDFTVPVLVANAGGDEGATDLRMELDTSGEVIYTRDVTLRSGSYTLVKIPVRDLARRVALPTRVIVSSIDDEETFVLTASADPRSITGPGLPTMLGGTSTLGEGNPSTLGPDREQYTDVTYGFPAEGWALTLEQPNGERRFLDSLIDEPDIEDTHTKAASWSATVPADRSLEQWDFDTRAYLTRDGEIVNIGWCDSVESSTDGQETVLSGPGPFGELRGDEMQVELVNNTDWRAAQKIVDTVAPEWDITVLRTDDPLIVTDEEYSGTPLSILKSFCDDYGFYFRPSSTHFRQGMMFVPGGVASLVDLDPISIDVNSTSEGYANEVIYNGAGDVRVVESDEAEIRRLAEDRDLRIADARETVSIDDDRVESETKARERAKAELRKRISNYENGGSIEMPARRIRPGLAYPMPSDSEVWHSARSVRLDGNGSIELPARMMRRLSDSGAMAYAIKVGDWSDLTNQELRLFGAWGTSSTVQTGSKRLTLQATTSGARSLNADAFLEPPTEGEWHIVHYEWEYRSDIGETIIMAGHDGEVVDADTASGRIDFGGVRGAAIGRSGSHYLDETLVEGAWFFKAPSEYDYTAVAPEEPVPGPTTHYGEDDAYGSGDYGINSAEVPTNPYGEVGYGDVYGNASLVTVGSTAIGEGAIGEGAIGGPASGGDISIELPQSSTRYARLYDGDNIPADDLVARYSLDETPDEDTAHDSVGGWHAELNDTRPAGRPVTLDTAKHTLTTTTGEFNRQFGFDEYLRAVAQR